MFIISKFKKDGNLLNKKLRNITNIIKNAKYWSFRYYSNSLNRYYKCNKANIVNNNKFSHWKHLYQSILTFLIKINLNFKNRLFFIKSKIFYIKCLCYPIRVFIIQIKSNYLKLMACFSSFFFLFYVKFSKRLYRYVRIEHNSHLRVQCNDYFALNWPKNEVSYSLIEKRYEGNCHIVKLVDSYW